MVYVFKFEHQSDFTKLFDEGQRVADKILTERKRLIEEDDDGRRPFPDSILFKNTDLNYLVIRCLTRRMFKLWSLDSIPIDYLSFRDNTGRYLRIDEDRYLVMTPFNLKIDLTGTDFQVVYQAYPNLHLIGAEINNTHVKVSCILELDENSCLKKENWCNKNTEKKKKKIVGKKMKMSGKVNKILIDPLKNKSL